MFMVFKNKIYVSGKITGLTYMEASRLFQKAETKLLAQGLEVVNPFKLSPLCMTEREGGKPHWTDHMRADIIELCRCNEIYMMEGWENSKGANIERQLAIDLGMNVIYEKTEVIGLKIIGA